MSEQNKKTGNRAIVIASAICAAVVIALVVVFAFGDMIVANVKMSKLKGEIADCDRIVISAPLRQSGLEFGSEAVVEGELVREVYKEFIKVSENITFDKMISGSGGFWNIQLKFYCGDEVHSVYLTEDGIYLAAANSYLFEIDDEAEQQYEDFYQMIEAFFET